MVRIFEGGCHCGRVRFSVRTDLSRVTRCNCSMCRRKGALNQRVAPGDFALAGADALTTYRFGTGRASHRFCSTCGVFVCGNPRTAPGDVTVNVRCLDEFDALAPTLRVVLFDGLNWEAAAARLADDDAGWTSDRRNA